MKARFSIPIVFVSELPRCEKCGCTLSTSGLCSSCAEHVQEVEHVTRVTIPLADVWEPGEMSDE